jgi:hypothetical protein
VHALSLRAEQSQELDWLRGVFMVGANAENREKAHVTGGDEVDVDIELDTQPRELTLPPVSARPWTATPKPSAFSTACPIAASKVWSSPSTRPKPASAASKKPSWRCEKAARNRRSDQREFLRRGAEPTLSMLAAEILSNPMTPLRTPPPDTTANAATFLALD